jgi:hypothetical protein
MGEERQVLDYVNRMRGSIRKGGAYAPAGATPAPVDSLYRALPPVQGSLQAKSDSTMGQTTRPNPSWLADVVLWLKSLGTPGVMGADTVNQAR